MQAAQRKNQRCQDLRGKMDWNAHSCFSEPEEGLPVCGAPSDGAVQVYVPFTQRQDLLRLEPGALESGIFFCIRIYSTSPDMHSGLTI